MFENPAAPLTQFITRVVVSWQQLADELELSWGLETGRHCLGEFEQRLGSLVTVGRRPNYEAATAETGRCVGNCTGQ